MKQEIKIREAFKDFTGTELLPNGCITFTCYMTGGKWNDTNPETIIQNILNNPNETGECFYRYLYIEKINTWLKKINRTDLQIPVLYNIATETKHTTKHTCSCGATWSTHMWVSDSPETALWGNGEPARVDNFICEYSTDVVEHFENHQECSSCIELQLLKQLIDSIPELENEVITRQRKALSFFQKNPDKSPIEYTVIHRSSGYNPTAKNRDGVRIGYTNRGKRTVDAAYLVKKINQ
jgi:hypothetical protein